MADTVVVVESAPTPPTPETPPTPVSPPSPDVLEIDSATATVLAHEDARDLGYALAQIDVLNQRVTTLDAQVAQLAANDVAQIDATTAVVAAVESVAADVEEMEPGDQVEIAPEPEPEDTTPGKTHWLHRSGREWAGK